MAWEDVPNKLVAYALETYAPPNADGVLLREFGVTNVANVPVERRKEFEAALDYRLGACQNLKTSGGKRWHM